jgi:hypothetical protein
MKKPSKHISIRQKPLGSGGQYSTILNKFATIGFIAGILMRSLIIFLIFICSSQLLAPEINKGMSPLLSQAKDFGKPVFLVIFSALIKFMNSKENGSLNHKDAFKVEETPVHSRIIWIKTQNDLPHYQALNEEENEKLFNQLRRIIPAQ